MTEKYYDIECCNDSFCTVTLWNEETREYNKVELEVGAPDGYGADVGVCYLNKKQLLQLIEALKDCVEAL